MQGLLGTHACWTRTTAITHNPTAITHKQTEAISGENQNPGKAQTAKR